MGDVRDTIQGTKPGTTSPKADLVATKERLYDLLQQKTQDYRTEGAAAQQRNMASMDRLRGAIDGVQKAIDELESY